MNVNRDYFLRHLGVGEVWALRETEAHAPVELMTEDQIVDGATETQVTQSTIAQDPLLQLREEIGQCHQCHLCASNRKMHWSDSVLEADTLVIYDWSESQIYQPQKRQEFERLFANIVKSLPIDSSKFATLNLLHAEPPSSNVQIPFDASAKYCGAFVRRAIALSKAKNLIVFGARAANAVLENTFDIQQLRASQWHLGEIAVWVTYSPYQLLVQPSLKRDAWQDLCRFDKVLKS